MVEHLIYGAYTMKNNDIRKKGGNEDRFVIHCEANKPAFFGVFDGHGGPEAAEFCREKLVGAIEENAKYKAGQFEEGITDAFFDTDVNFIADMQLACGSTVNLCRIADGVCICANSGDARSILARAGHAVQLSEDHKPGRADETARIDATGAFVTANRVFGCLAVSRSLGDREFKMTTEERNRKTDPLEIDEMAGVPQAYIKDPRKPIYPVTVLPDVTRTPLDATCDFLVVACDGLYDLFSNDEIVAFVSERLHKLATTKMFGRKGVTHQNMDWVAQELAEAACKKQRTHDDITIIVVAFKTQY